MTMAADIRMADRVDTTAVANLIASAFHPLDVARWLIEDDGDRTRILPAYFRIFVDHALDRGVVHTTTDRQAAALWLPTIGTPTPPPDYDTQLAAAVGPYLDRFLALYAAFDTRHPAAPHHHLALLAVHPDRQRRGLGSALLTHHQRRLDTERMPVYLEASSPHSRRLYLRHGYHDLLAEAFHLPDGGPPLWPMWRPPSAATGHR
jgi:GNAT superfamily N-acetyltransferase